MHAFLAAVTAGLLLSQTPTTQGQDPAVRHVQLEAGVIFAKIGERELRFDVVMPAEGDGPFPGIVCLHGGGWVGGDRGKMSETLKTLAARGYVAVAPDFRLAPQDPFPAAIEDCKAAIRFLRANARDYRIDGDRMGVVGFSAGAHLACLLGLTDGPDGLEGDGGNLAQSSRVQAVVSFSAPTDLVADEWTPVVERTNLVPFLGGTRAEKGDLYRRASPVTYADRKGQPPFLLFQGTADAVVRPEQAKRLADRLQAAGGTAQLVTVEGAGHGDWHGVALSRSLQQMMDFLDQKLKK